MNRWLNDAERNGIAERYAEHIIYRLLRPIALCWMQRYKVPWHPAELLYACVYIIDEMATLPPDERRHYSRELCWSEMMEFMQLAHSTDEEVKRAELMVAITAGCVAELLLRSKDIQWLMIGNELLIQSESRLEHEHSTLLHERIKAVLLDSQQEELSRWMHDYLRSDACLSDEMNELLEDLRTRNATSSATQHVQDAADEDDDAADDTFTLRQTVILMQELLNISLDAGDNNIAKLSRFIHRVTGRKTESIRSAINKLKTNKKTPQKELKQIAAAISQFNPQLAKDILARSD